MHGHFVESGFALLVTAAGPWAFWHGFRSFGVQQLIRNTPTARVRSMAIGMVEVNGRLEPRSRVNAPFSGRPCVWWEVEVATRSSNSRNGVRTWNRVHHAASGHPFFLRDETGVALVYPQGADCKVPFDVSEETHGFGVPDMYMEWMKSERLGMCQMWALGPMRFRERRLEADQHVYVLGRANPKAVARTVSFDEEALEATGTDSLGAMRVRPLDEQVTAVIRRGPHDPAFIVSTASEREMSTIYGLKAWAGLVAGPLLTLFGAWCLMELAKANQLFR